MPSANPTPVMLSANLYVSAAQVRVRDLTANEVDTVSLWFGDATANVQIIGSLAEVTAVLRAATEQVSEVLAARQGVTVHTEGGAR